MSRRKALALILFLWILSVASILGRSLFLKQKYISGEKSREDEIRDMAERIREGECSEVSVDADALAVAGEEEPVGQEDPASESESDEAADSSAPVSSGTHEGAYEDPMGSLSSSSGSYTLRAYGTISIPSIDCELPLWDGAGKVELRYGAGRMPGSAEAGASGNLVIFGHRMRRHGSIFNRLGEVRTGDSIIIERAGQAFTYTVDSIETIEPSFISAYIGMEKEGDPGSCRITLITCTPIGVGSHRLIITGHLASGG